MVYQGGLVRTLFRAGCDWNRHRAEGRRLRRWVEAGRVVLSVRPELDDLPCVSASIILKAIAEGADEVLISPRRLTGLRDVEMHPRFWEADYGAAVREGAASSGVCDTREGWEAGLDHFARFHGFARFDEYHGTSGVVRLVGGYAVQVFEGYVGILKEVFRRPRRLAIDVEEGWDGPGRGRGCVISVRERVCGVGVPDEGVGLRVEYFGDGAGGARGGFRSLKRALRSVGD